MATDLETLLVQETKARIYETALLLAQNLGLPVDSWQAGDPTRSLYHLESEILATLEEVVVNFIKAGFLDYATGNWLKVLAEQVFNLTVPEATAAECTVRLTNPGTGVYTVDAGDLTVQNSTTGKTYHNTSGGTLNAGPGTTLDLDFAADELGSDSNAAVGEIDTMVIALVGPGGAVTCSNTTAAVGSDKQDEAVTRQQCRDKLGSLSPNGPKEAYSYVARNSDLTGVTSVTRVRTYPDSTTGQVSVYLASEAGAVPGADVTAVADAIATWATPLCITPAVASASAVTVNVTYEVWVYQSVNKTSAEIQADISAALIEMFADRPIGGDIIPPAATGSLYHSMIESTIRGVYPQIFRVSLTTPAGDTALANNQVASLGTVSPTVNIVADPR